MTVCFFGSTFLPAVWGGHRRKFCVWLYPEKFWAEWKWELKAAQICDVVSEARQCVWPVVSVSGPPRRSLHIFTYMSIYKESSQTYQTYKNFLKNQIKENIFFGNRILFLNTMCVSGLPRRSLLLLSLFSNFLFISTILLHTIREVI